MGNHVATPPQQINMNMNADEQGGIAMMPPPPQPDGCPPGLEYLTEIDQILVKQKVELLEVFTGFETKNKYIVLNSMAQQVYYIEEDTDCCTRQCYGNARPFDMKVLDNTNREVMHFYRPYKCGPCSCCGGCCQQEIEIQSPPGQIIGYVKQDPTCSIPKLTIYAADKTTPILRIVGPCCTIACCGDVTFKVFDMTGENQLGTLTKQWSGLLREAFTDADYFGITFPMDLDVKVKASLMGALMLIDFMFYERQKDKDNNNNTNNPLVPLVPLALVAADNNDNESTTLT